MQNPAEIVLKKHTDSKPESVLIASCINGSVLIDAALTSPQQGLYMLKMIERQLEKMLDQVEKMAKNPPQEMIKGEAN